LLFFLKVKVGLAKARDHGIRSFVISDFIG